MSEKKITYVHIRVVEARNILSADTNGFSDAYVKLRVNGESKHRSVVCPKTLHPQWQFDSSFHVASGSIEEREGDVLLEVFDRDHLSGNEFLGQVQFRIGDIVRRRVIAAYFDLLTKDFSDKTRGEMCVLITHGNERLEADERAELLDDIQRELKAKINRGKAISSSNNQAEQSQANG